MLTEVAVWHERPAQTFAVLCPACFPLWLPCSTCCFSVHQEEGLGSIFGLTVIFQEQFRLQEKQIFLLLQARIWEKNEVSDTDEQIHESTVVWIDAIRVGFVHTWLEKPAKVFMGFYWEVNVDAKSIYHIFGYVPLSHMTFSSLRAMNTFLFHYICLFYFNPFLTNPPLRCSMSSSFSPCREVNALL